MAPMRGIVWIAMSTLIASHIAAAGPDRIGQEGRSETRLGQRLAAIAKADANVPGGPAFWKEAREIILTSNAARDSRADAETGHIGFMTHANDAIAERPVAPGLKCLDRSETSRRAIFLFAYRAPMAREAGGALLAFDTYAHLYNAEISKSGALGETSCVSTGW